MIVYVSELVSAVRESGSPSKLTYAYHDLVALELKHGLIRYDPADPHRHVDLDRTDIIVSNILTSSQDILLAEDLDPSGNLISRKRCVRLEVNNALVVPRYLVELLRHRVDELAASHMGETSRSRIRLADILRMTLELPDIDTQMRLSKMLQAADRVKETRDRAEARRNRLRSATFRKLIDETPGEDMRRLRLRNLLTLSTGTAALWEASDLTRSNSDSGMITIGRSGLRCGRVSVLRAPPKSTEVFVAEPTSANVNRRFLIEALRQANLRRYAFGVLQPRLTATSILSIEIALPSLDRQREFAAQAIRLDALEELARNASSNVDRLWNAIRVRAFGSVTASFERGTMLKSI